MDALSEVNGLADLRETPGIVPMPGMSITHPANKALCCKVFNSKIRVTLTVCPKVLISSIAIPLTQIPPVAGAADSSIQSYFGTGVEP